MTQIPTDVFTTREKIFNWPIMWYKYILFRETVVHLVFSFAQFLFIKVCEIWSVYLYNIVFFFLYLIPTKSIFRFIYLDTSDRLMHIEHKFYCRDGEFSNLILFICYNINTKIQYYTCRTYCVSVNSSLLFIFASIITCVCSYIGDLVIFITVAVENIDVIFTAIRPHLKISPLKRVCLR